MKLFPCRLRQHRASHHGRPHSGDVLCDHRHTSHADDSAQNGPHVPDAAAESLEAVIVVSTPSSDANTLREHQ